MASVTGGTLSNYVWGQWTDHGTSTSSGTAITDSVWDRWSSPTYSENTGNPTTSDVVWIYWTKPAEYGSGDVKVTITDSQGHAVWTKWVDQYDCGTLEEYRARAEDTLRKAYHEVKKITPPTTEQLRARKAQQEIRKLWSQIIADEQKKEREEAENVALDLLLEIIGEEDYKRYKETGRLFVKGRHYDYVVNKSGGVHRIAKDKVVDFAKKKVADGKFICVHPKNQYSYPETDNVISLKMWIENSENKFLKIGNKHHTVTKIKDFDKVVGI
jgi:hypothetical protein